MRRFTEQTEAVLRQAGWNHGRSTDVQRWLDLWSSWNCPSFPTAIRFLAEFGGLVLLVPVQLNPQMDPRLVRIVSRMRTCLSIDPFAAAGPPHPDYVRLAGSQLVPIGAIDGLFALYMAADGRVFGGYDEEFHLFGLSGDDAIDVFCTGQESRQVLQR